MIDFTLLTKTIQRHPLTCAFDVLLFLVVMFAATMLVLTYDLASFWSHLPPRERQITAEEAVFLCTLAIGGICIFLWRRMPEERQDRLRRAESLDLRAMAMIDPLTALPNRRKFMSALQRATSGSNRQTIAVCLLDLNDFKQINDSHGHQAGDEVLRIVAERFKAATRSGDLLARLGGDEFALIAKGVISPAEVKELANRFIATLADEIRVDDQGHVVGVSIGVAMFPHDGGTPTDILRSADLAMYRAKQNPVSSVLLFEEKPPDRLRA